ncbi:DUF2332 domain-containing protein [Actinoallomurus rhizosphaericola]|uniref:DUF2332 domain-containing protein n=1 Tax=Actinoallomurus rhizosphaericola TaxID=2952536 RepID=UPI0020905C70|nr:DUF2332 domain-containing protein [Actinoallomurus rhizosphaericola]MCO5992052.1 DUF2332 domain-containing protein [Actinoallomurus rhizosphaericola]
MPYDDLARLFEAAPSHFATSPLYGRLGAVVAADERLLAIASEARPGQLPSNLLFAAVHYLLLRDPSHELAAWYPTGAARTPEGEPGPAFTDFCLTRRADIVELMHGRLVQTNVVKRATALRLGLALVARLTGEPVTVIEVGCSAGLLLRFDEYRYDFGGRTWGRPASPVEIRTRWEGAAPAPDLGPLPAIADRVGVDLHPVDVTDPDERLWLRALIWPENRAQADLQDAALSVVAADPPRTVAGDAVEVLPRLVAEVPSGTPVVVFHAATRLHVAADRRDRFDQAIAAVGRTHALFHLSLEAEPGLRGAAFALRLRHGDGAERLAIADGHVEWIAEPPAR